MKVKEVRLYNIILPVWLFWLFPITWLVILPGNLLIDFGVLYLTMKCLKIAERKEIAKKVILKVFLFGFLADFVGVALMFICSEHTMQPFSSVLSFILVTAFVAVSGVCIYLLDLKFALKDTDLSLSHKKKLALSLAIFTAPYIFFIPAY